MHAGLTSLGNPLFNDTMKSIATHTRCPECGEILLADLFERNGRVYLCAACPHHGPWEKLMAKDASLFWELRRRHANSPGVPVDGFHREWSLYSPLVTTCAIDVTKRCNLRCPDCFSDAGSPLDEPSFEEIMGMLPPYTGRGFRPNISLVGGESLLREDIDQIIAGIAKRGFTPRLNSNGKGLLDRALVARLRQAGLQWVILQFDGFSPATSLRFRGEDLIKQKLQVIQLLAEFDINVHFAVMVMAGVNDHELTDILRFALKTPNVRRVSFYPRTQVGRNPHENDESTDLSDVVRSLEQSSNGSINRRDLLHFKRLFALLFGLTNNPVFRNRACIVPFIVRLDGETVQPINRLLPPGFSTAQWRGLFQLVGQTQRLWRFDRGEYDSGVLPVNIEKFYDNAAFDLDASANCHHVYLTRHGYIPFCLYNSFFRDQPTSPC